MKIRHDAFVDNTCIVIKLYEKFDYDRLRDEKKF